MGEYIYERTGKKYQPFNRCDLGSSFTKEVKTMR